MDPLTCRRLPANYLQVVTLHGGSQPLDPHLALVFST